MPDNFPVSVQPTPFKSPKIMLAEKGKSIKGIIDQMYEANGIPPVWRDYGVMVEINGIPVTREDWHLTPSESDHVMIHVAVHGGGGSGSGKKDTTRTILSIVVVVVATIVTIWGGGWGGGVAAAALGVSEGVAGSIMGMAVMTAGMLLINALCPIRSLDTDQEASDSGQTYSITGARNMMNPFGVVPVVLGTHKMFPCIATQPWIELVGNDEYLRMAFVWGYGRLAIGTIYIGDTPITSYSDCTVITYEGLAGDAALQLIPQSSKSIAIGVELPYAAEVVRAAPLDVDYINLEVSWPGGLGSNYGDEDGPIPTSCMIYVYVRTNGGAWGLGYSFLQNSVYTTKAARMGFGFQASRALAYEIKMVKMTPDGDGQNNWNTCAWINVQGYKNEDPVTFPKPLAITEVRIKASQQLNGVIDTLNATVSSYAPIWNGAAWSAGEAITNNPAALFRKVLMHNANARPRTAAQIDDAGLGAWYTFCANRGYAFNQVRDFRSSVWETLADIAQAGRASPTLTDGLWGVVVDSGTESVVQHITPRNSWGFSAEKVLYNKPHAFRCAFSNELENYAKDEIIVYDDGYNSSNATIFESLEFPGITSPALVWKFGRYHMAQARLRPERYTVNLDFEHLVCRRGSKVRVSHDVPLWGSGWGRVKSLTTSGAHTTGVILDDLIVMEAGKSYCVRFRLPDAGNTSLLVPVDTTAGETNTLTFTTPVAVASGPAVGDLAMFGETSLETVECLVQSIERSGDYTAKLTLVDKSPEIYLADTGAIPAFNTHVTRPTDLTKLVPGPPAITGVRSGTECLEVLNGAIKARIFVSLHPALSNIKIDHYRVRYTPLAGSEYSFVDVSPESTTAILPDVVDGFTYSIQAQAVSVYGVASAWSEAVTHVVIGQSAAPSDVEDLACNIVASVAHLSWTAVTDIDLSHYRIRWSPLTSGATWANSVDVVNRVGKPATTVTVPAMVGTYLIKAVDFAGNMSATAGAAITNIAAIAGLNLVETVTQPPFDGTGVGVEYVPGQGGLILESANDLYDETDLYDAGDLYVDGALLSEGTYSLTDYIDLWAVYTSRVTAALTASGIDLAQSDLYNLIDLYTQNNLYGEIEGKYSSSLEMRITSDDPAGAPTWSAWQAFLVGDYTTRAYQFRVRLKGTPPTTTPIVTALTVTVDMPDRVIGFNAAVGIGGADITFSPAFKIIPEIGISVSDGHEGDGYTITSKSVSGFHIAFTNGGSGVARNISGIAKGFGELSP